MNKKTAVVLGFSGGVDSSAAAILLEQQGFRVIPVLLDFVSPDSSELRQRADRVARSLGLETPVVETVKNLFAEQVIADIAQACERGLTPNPCIRCNARVKFPALAEVADRLGVEHLATGHYLRRRLMPDGRPGWLMAEDRQKDQSYFLLSVSRSLLSRTLFPLAEMKKSQVLELVAGHGFQLDNYRESQELCFLHGAKYQDFLRSRGLVGEPGEVIGPGGEILGHHQGLQNYTIGQRRGLAIAYREPLYVTALDFAGRRLYLGTREMTAGQGFEVEKINWLTSPARPPQGSFACRIRHRHQPAAASCRQLADNRLLVEFDQPQFAVTPGQGAAFYQGERLLGGGIISRVITGAGAVK